MRWSRWAGLAIALVVLAGSTWAWIRNPFSTPEAALATFYGGEARPECMLIDPLRRAGRAVVPLVIAALPDRAMPRRRYAIGFLGEGGYREALPALEAILRDATELDHVRGDALLAISGIDPELARRLAGELPVTPENLGRIVWVVSQGGSALKALHDRSCS